MAPYQAVVECGCPLERKPWRFRERCGEQGVASQDIPVVRDYASDVVLFGCCNPGGHAVKKKKRFGVIVVSGVLC